MLPKRFATFACAVAVVALLAAGFTRLRFDVDVLNLLPEDLAASAGLKLYQTNFANARELIVTIENADPDACEQAARAMAEALRAATNVVEEVVWQPPWLERPGESAEFIAYSWLNQPPSEFRKLFDSLSPSNLPAVLAESRDALTTSFSPETVGRRSYDPLRLTDVPMSFGGMGGTGSELFSAPDGTFRLLFVKAGVPIDDYRQCTRWLKEINSMVERTDPPLPGGTRVRYTGRPAFVSEISGGMQRDMAGPSSFTLCIIAILFYISHRRLKPLLWLALLLVSILVVTCAIGGLLFGTLNIVSLGFASILLGLAEDFGIVLYQESRSHPELGVREIRALAGAGILWSAVTTCSAFLVLNLAGLPGLGQLGTLVAIGIAVAAIVMLFAYLPPLMPKRSVATARVSQPAPAVSRQASLAATVAIIVLCIGVLLVQRAGFDNSPSALRPRQSEAYSAAEEIKTRLKRTQEPLWVLVQGPDEEQVLRRLRIADSALSNAVSRGVISNATLPFGLWPDAEAQRINISTAKSLLARREEIASAVLQSGFTSNALGLADSIFNTWQRAASTPAIFWPTNRGSQWLLEKFTARAGTNFIALGLVERHTDESVTNGSPALVELSAKLAAQSVYLSGWEILGQAVFAEVRADFWKVMLPMALLVGIALWLTFRRFADVLLSLATLLVSGLVLWTVMSLAGWSWNLLNLMAIPLLLGMGVDFAIHIQLALRRYGGNLAAVRGSIGRALLLAGSTTVAGFGSLGFSNNAGMASLGKVCGLGILVSMLVAVFLLPHWWVMARRFGGREKDDGGP